VVTTEAQFDGERAVQERRKLIEDLVATGVPAVTAADLGRPRAPYLAVLYLLIPLAVVAYLVGQRNPATSGEAPTATPTATSSAPAGGGTGGGGAVTLVAQNISFDTDQIELPANKNVSVTLENQDTAPHNFAIYRNEQDATAQTKPLFRGDPVDPNASDTYEFKSPPKGSYFFHCDIHPTMSGEVTVG
jgi:plastocyanin